MLGTRRSVGQFIPQYRTDGQYDHTKTWACVRKAQSTETLRATPKVVPRGPRSCRRSRAEAAERGPGQWRNTEQRPLERSACRALRRKPATNVRFWTQSDRRHRGLRNVFSDPDHTRFGPKQGRKAAVQCSDPSNAYQENDAQDADEHLGDDATCNLHQDPVSSE